MQAGEVRAGDRAHVHHIIVYVREPKPSNRPERRGGQADPSRRAGARACSGCARPARPAPARSAAPGGGDAMLVNWAVGEDAPVYLPGTAKRIPAGSTLIFQVHYTTNGKPGVDRSRIGLIFAKEPPRQEIRTGIIANPVFAIPAGAANHEVEAEATFSDDVRIWTMHPHMHLRGKDMTYTAIYPDGRSEIVLQVPKFDFGWQTDYWLAEPLTLPKGSKLHVRAHFDNSPANRSNPDPTKVVRWGDQTWEEMMIGFFTYTVEGQDLQDGEMSIESVGLSPRSSVPRTQEPEPWTKDWLLRHREAVDLNIHPMTDAKADDAIGVDRRRRMTGDFLPIRHEADASACDLN